MDIVKILDNFNSEGWTWYNPGSRIFYLNLMFSAFIALVFFVYVKKQSLKSILNYKNLKNYWFHPSAQIDYQIYILNAFFKSLFFAPLLGLSVVFSKWTIQSLFLLFPDFSTWSISFTSIFIGTLALFVWDDGLRFAHHYLMHKVPFLWSFHKVHHSAEVLTPITLFRIHPAESLMATFRNSFSFGVSGGVLMFLYSGRFEFLTLLGVNIFVFSFNFFTGNLRHSHISLGFGKFERLFMSPKQHHIHHSLDRNHFDKNFGVALSIWDQLAGTYLESKNQAVQKFGLADVPPDSLKTLLAAGFKFMIVLGLFASLKHQVAEAAECTSFLEPQSYNYDFEHLQSSSTVSDVKLALSFEEWKFVQVLPHQVDYNFRSWVPGEFRVKIFNRKTEKHEYYKSYFAKTELEKYFLKERFPITTDLKNNVLRGRFEYLDNEPVFIIYGLSVLKKEPVGVTEIDYLNKYPAAP